MGTKINAVRDKSSLTLFSSLGTLSRIWSKAVQACHIKRQCLLGLMICQYVASPGLDLFQMKNTEWMAVELKCLQMKIVIFILVLEILEFKYMAYSMVFLEKKCQISFTRRSQQNCALVKCLHIQLMTPLEMF